MEQSRKDASYMKKKLLTCLAMVVCILTLTACGKEMTQNSFTTKDEAKEVAEGFCKDLQAMQQEAAERGQTLTEYIEGYTRNIKSVGYALQLESNFRMLLEDVQPEIDMYISGLNSLNDISEDFGSFVSILSDETEVTITDDSAEVAVKIQGDKIYDGNKQRTATVDIVLTAEGYESITISTNYDMGELMEKAALNTLLGMGTVFAVLILIYALIACFKFIPPIQAKCEKIGNNLKKKFRKFWRKLRGKSEQTESEKAPEPVQAAPQAVVVEETDDTELIAVIAAAIAASEGVSSADGYVVRSIIRR